MPKKISKAGWMACWVGHGEPPQCAAATATMSTGLGVRLLAAAMAADVLALPSSPGPISPELHSLCQRRPPPLLVRKCHVLACGGTRVFRVALQRYSQKI
jgi:hypothetical protein